MQALARVAAATAFGCSIAFSNSAVATTPCDRLDSFTSTADERAGEGVWQGLLRILWHQEESSQPQDPVPGLFFTSRDGFSRYPACEGDRPWSPYVYYPIGLILQKTGHSEEIGGKPYELVTAEHGLLLYIDAEDITRVEPGRTYFFADGLTFPVYCGRDDDCRSGEARDQKQQLMPFGAGRYAVTDHEVTTCDPVTIELFDAGGISVRRQDGQPWHQRLVPCLGESPPGTPIDGANARRDANLKIVSEARFLSYFKEPLNFTYTRMSESLLDTVFGNAMNVKDCNVSGTETFTASVSAGVGAEVPLYIFRIGASGEASAKWQLENKVGKDLFVFYSTYQAKPYGRSSGNYISVDDTYPIETVLSCGVEPNDAVKRDPGKLYSIRVHNANLPQGALTVLRSEFEQVYARQRTTEEEGVHSGWVQAVVDARRRGQFWQVSDYYSYFRLRNAMRRYIDQNTLLYELLDEAEQAVYDRYVDYFSHLILAASVEWRSR